VQIKARSGLTARRATAYFKDIQLFISLVYLTYYNNEKYFTLTLFIFLSSVAISQKIKKSWILIDTENLSTDSTNSEDSKYRRYEFSNDRVYLGFNPAWNGGNYPWSLDNKDLTVGFATYNLEVLNDTCLVFAKAGFKRFKLISEEKYGHLKHQSDTALALHGNTVYIADNYITPRLKKQYNISDLIKMSDYNIKKEIIFLAKFVVTDKGKVDRIEIVNGINNGFDQEFKDLLMKTTSKWAPALLNGKPVNSQLTYTIHYINSITDY